VTTPTYDMSKFQMPGNYTQTPGVMDSLKDAVTPGGRTFMESMGDVFMPGGGPSVTDIMKANPGMGLETAKQVAADMAPGLFRTFGPAAAAGTALAAGAGFFTTPKEDPVDTPPTGAELVAGDPETYRIADLEVRRSEGPTEIASPYTIVPGQGTFVNPFYRPQDPRNLPVYAAAEGGEIFPRRVGGIMPNEGIPGQDSVRAMLMPGEFVMTTDAVKGLGGGNMRQGINNMYEMMRGLESRGKAMA